MDLRSVETPAAVVDLGRVRENVRRVAAYCDRHGFAWRPHVKTHKSLEIARLQIAAGARGLAVATLRESEVMAHASSDLLLAYPPVGPGKVSRLLSLPEHVELRVALDHADVLRPLAREAARRGREVGVLVELDAGLRRVGVQEPEDAVALARLAAELDGVRFDGLLFYPGHIRIPVADQAPLVEELSRRLRRFCEALHDAWLPPPHVSGGSTPTLWRSHEIGGLTEIRAGTCVYNDRDIVALGAAEPSWVAYSVLATVVSTAAPGRAVVDAGSKALAKEAFRSAGEGFGVLLDRPEVTVAALSEEHGILDLTRTSWHPRIGERVRIVPNHVCVSVNLQDRVHLVEGDEVRPIPLEARGREGYRG